MQLSSDPGLHPFMLASHSSTPEPSALVLAQMVDRATQEQGLSGDAKQKLYLYAIQTSPPTYALWLCAATLRNESAINNATNSMAGLSTRVDTLMDLTRREYRVPRTTKTMLKKIQWRFIVTAKVSYRTIPDCVKAFVVHNSQMFGLDLYTMDSTVHQAVNQVIDRDIHQCHGTFRKAIFTDIISGRPLGDASNRICSVLSAQVGSPAPRYIQAHIAQLRLIAFERIAAIRAAEQAAAAQASSGGSESINTIAPQVQASRRPRNNTGFWIAVHATFNELVSLNGAVYDNSEDWKDWEDDVIAQDVALFTGNGHFAGDIRSWMMTDSA